LGRQAVDFLGHRISADGVVPLLKHVEAIQKYPRPTDMKSLQSFLGLVNFYRRFVPAAAKILRPLTDALRGSGRSRLPWTASMEAAFLEAK
jgi:hypothetical protein